MMPTAPGTKKDDLFEYASANAGDDMYAHALGDWLKSTSTQAPPGDDPYAGLRPAGDLGVPGWQGASPARQAAMASALASPAGPLRLPQTDPTGTAYEQPPQSQPELAGRRFNIGQEVAYQVGAGGVAQYIPFVRGIAAAGSADALRTAAQRVQAGAGSPQDIAMLQDHLRRQEEYAKWPWMRKALDIAAAIPAYAAEIGTGGGVARGAGLLTSIGTKAGSSLAAKAAGATARAATIAGTTTALQIPSIVADASNKTLGLKTVSRDGKELVVGADVEPILDALPASVLDNYIENLSEFTGGLVGVPASKLLGPLKKTIMQRWIGLKPGNTAARFAERAASVGGWHGMIGELFEERMASAMKAATGIGDWSGVIPTPEQFLTELVAFSIPGVAKTVAARAYQAVAPTGDPVVDAGRAAAREVANEVRPAGTGSVDGSAGMEGMASGQTGGHAQPGEMGVDARGQEEGQARGAGRKSEEVGDMDRASLVDALLRVAPATDPGIVARLADDEIREALRNAPSQETEDALQDERGQHQAPTTEETEVLKPGSPASIGVGVPLSVAGQSAKRDDTASSGVVQGKGGRARTAEALDALSDDRLANVAAGLGIDASGLDRAALIDTIGTRIRMERAVPPAPDAKAKRPPQAGVDPGVVPTGSQTAAQAGQKAGGGRVVEDAASQADDHIHAESERFREEFSAKSGAHKKISDQLDAMVADGSLGSPLHADVVRRVLADTSPEALSIINVGSGVVDDGRAGVAIDAITGRPPMRKTTAARAVLAKEYSKRLAANKKASTSFDLHPSSQLLEEVMHILVRIVPNAAQTKVLRREYASKTPEQWAAEFEADGLTPEGARYAAGMDEHGRIHAASFDEWAAHKAVMHALGEASKSPANRAIMERVYLAFKRALERIVQSLGFVPDHLRPIFEAIRRGDIQKEDESGRRPAAVRRPSGPRLEAEDLQTITTEGESRPAQAPRQPGESEPLPPKPPTIEKRPDLPAERPAAVVDAETRRTRPDQIKPIAIGRDSYVVLGNGKRLRVRYGLFDADQLVPSHDARSDFDPNDGAWPNERQYQIKDQAASSRKTVNEIATSPDPGQAYADTTTATDGPPIITIRGEVPGGNARTQGIQLAYHLGEGGAKTWREAASTNAAKFGIDAEAVSKTTRPIIVRVLDEADIAEFLADRAGEIRLSALLNESRTSGKTAATEAVSKASRLGKDTIDYIVGELSEYETLADALRNHAVTSRILQALSRAGAWGAKEQEAFMSDGLLNKQGRVALEEALLGTIVQDVKALTAIGDGLTNAMVKAIPSLMGIREAMNRPGSDVRFYDLFRDAIKAMDLARGEGAVYDFAVEQINPAGMDPVLRDARAVALADVLRKGTREPRKFAEKMRTVADAIREAANGQVDLMAGRALSPGEAFDAELGVRPLVFHGRVFTDEERKSFAAELKQYREERARRLAEVRARLGPDGGQIPHTNGHVSVISRNTGEDAAKYPWRVTVFSKDRAGKMRPWGHTLHEALDTDGAPDKGPYYKTAVGEVASQSIGGDAALHGRGLYDDDFEASAREEADRNMRLGVRETDTQWGRRWEVVRLPDSMDGEAVRVGKTYETWDEATAAMRAMKAATKKSLNEKIEKHHTEQRLKQNNVPSIESYNNAPRQEWETEEEYRLRQKFRGAAEDTGTLWGRALAQDNQDSLGFISRLEQWTREKLRGAMPAGQVRVALKNAQLPADEIKWTGIDDWLAEKKGEKVTPDQVREYLEQNRVELREKVLGGEGSDGRAAEAVARFDQAGQRARRILSRIDANAYTAFEDAARFGGQTPDEAFESFLRPYGEDQRTRLRAAYLDIYTLPELMAEMHGASRAVQGGLNSPQVTETKYSRFTLPGGENYREVLLTLPRGPGIIGTGMDGEPMEGYEGGAFQSSHFSEPNIIAHMRLKDRVTPDGKRVLFAEEIQSDWHEAGRDRGYRQAPATEADIELKFVEGTAPDGQSPSNYPGYWESFDRRTGQMITRHGGREPREAVLADAVRDANRDTAKPPPAPWSKTWHEMTFRRLLRLAAEGGYDAVGWTTGKTQTERYEGLAQQVDRVKWTATRAGGDDATTRTVSIYSDRARIGDFVVDIADGKIVLTNGPHSAIDKMKGKHLREVVGADLAKEILGSPNAGEKRGTDITIGGDGMRSFYDRDLVNYARKYGKKWGAEPRDGEVMTGPVDHPSGDPSRMKGQGSSPAHLLPITPEMRDSVLEDGQPLFGRFLWDRDDSESKQTSAPAPGSLFDTMPRTQDTRAGASSPSERGAGDAFNAKGGATAPESPATTSPQTGRTGIQPFSDAAYPDANTSLVDSWDRARLDRVASDTPGASANIIDAFGGDAKAEAVVRAVLDRINMAEMMSRGLDNVNTASPMRLQNMKKLRGFLTGTFGRLHQQLHAISRGYKRADVEGAIKSAGTLADLLMVKIGDDPHKIPDSPKMGSADAIRLLRSIDTGHLRRWYKGEKTLSINVRNDDESPTDAAKRLKGRGEPLVLKDGRWQFEQHQTLAVPAVLPIGTRVRVGTIDLDTGASRLSTPDFIVRRLIPNYGGDTSNPHGTYQAALERQPFPGEQADASTHYVNVIVDKTGRLVAPLMPFPGSSGWSMGLTLIDTKTPPDARYSGATMFDRPRDAAPSTELQPSDAHALARAIGHPNNTSIREDISAAIQGKGPWSVRDYLVRQVGAEEADAAIGRVLRERDGPAAATPQPEPDGEFDRHLADIAAERSAVDSFIRDRIGPDGGQVVLPDGNMFIISRNTGVNADEFPWRVTAFSPDSNGTLRPWGHTLHKALDTDGKPDVGPYYTTAVGEVASQSVGGDARLHGRSLFDDTDDPMESVPLLGVRWTRNKDDNDVWELYEIATGQAVSGGRYTTPEAAAKARAQYNAERKRQAAAKAAEAEKKKQAYPSIESYINAPQQPWESNEDYRLRQKWAESARNTGTLFGRNLRDDFPSDKAALAAIIADAANALSRRGRFDGKAFTARIREYLPAAQVDDPIGDVVNKAIFTSTRSRPVTVAEVERWIDETPGASPVERPRDTGSLFGRSLGDPEDRPGFREWFGDSAVVDADGKPMVVYHGSSNVDFDQFDRRRASAGGLLGAGFYFTDDPRIAGGGEVGDAMLRGYAQAPGQMDADTRKRVADEVRNADHPSGQREAVARMADGFESGAIPYSDFEQNVYGVREAARKHYTAPAEGVIPVYLSIQNPLDVSDVAAVHEFLRRAVESAELPNGLRHLVADRAHLFRDVKPDDPALAASPNVFVRRALGNGNTVLLVARNLGYDGIVQSSKGVRGIPPHRIYVAFEPDQIKSVFAQSFTAGNNNMLFGRALDQVNQDSLGFVSRLEQWVADKLRGPMPAGQIRVALKNAGLPADEIKWTGIDDWLAEKKGEKVTPDQVREYLSQSRVQLRERVLGGSTEDQALADAVRRHDAAEQEMRRIVSRIDARDAAFDAFEDAVRFYNTGRDDEVTDEEAFNKAIQAYGADVQEKWRSIGALEAFKELRAARRERTRAQAESPRSEGTHFESYTLPGGANYREVLLTLPPPNIPVEYPEALTELPTGYELVEDSSKPAHARWGIVPPGQSHARPFAGSWISPERAKSEAIARLNDDAYAKAEQARRDAVTNRTFRSTHFPEPNIIAHMRLNDRTTPDGKRVLFAEEIQSDWHEQGRDRGYRRDALPDGYKAVQVRGAQGQPFYWNIVDPDGNSAETPRGFVQANSEAEAISEYLERTGSVPPAPWSKTWHEMAFRRLLRLAASGGYDAVGWTTGDTQIDRYEGLAQRVEKIEWEVLDDGVRKVFVVLPGNDGVDFEVNDGKVFNASGANAGALGGQPLRDVVGADLAKRIMAEPNGSVRGPDIRIGGDGMRSFYDRDLVNYARKYGKKWGAEPRDGEVMTGPVDHPSGDPSRMKGQGSSPAHLLPITPEMRDSVLEDGQPLFGRKLSEDEEAHPLVALHNTTVAGLQAALRMGGIPGPSVAILKHGDSFENYGRVTMIGRRSMIDPQTDSRNKVFGADAYSPNQPPEYHVIDRKGYAKLRDRIIKETDAVPLQSGHWSTFEDAVSRGNRSQQGGLAAATHWLETELASKVMYLRELGEKVPIPNHSPVARDSKARRPDVRAWVEAYMARDGTDRHPTGEQLEPLKKLLGEIGAKELNAALKLDEQVTPEDAEPHWSNVRHVFNDALDLIDKKMVPNIEAVKRNVKRLIAKHGGEAALRAWASKLAATAFTGERVLKRGRGSEPYTLDNVADAMFSKGSNAAEKNMVYGLGQARAAALRPIGTVRELHNRKHELASKADVEARKGSNNKAFFALVDQLRPYHYESGFSFNPLDDASKAIGQIIRHHGRAGEFLRRNGFTGVPAHIADEAVKVAELVRGTPTEYFEGKPQRAVRISEFAAAVIPKDAPAGLDDELKSHGVEPVRYNPNRQDARRRAVAATAEKYATDDRGQGSTLFGRSLFDQSPEEEREPQEPVPFSLFEKPREPVVLNAPEVSQQPESGTEVSQPAVPKQPREMTAPVPADAPVALDGPANAEAVTDPVTRRLDSLAKMDEVPPAAWRSLRSLVAADPVAATAYARQKSLQDIPDAKRYARLADKIAKSFGLNPRMEPAGKGKSGDASEGQRRAKEGGEFGPNGEWYPGGSFINTVKENPKGDGSAPSGTDRPMVEAASDPMRPWRGASVDDEYKWFGTRVRVAPELRGESEIGGAIQRVLNGGRVVEVKPDGVDTTFRYDIDRVTVEGATANRIMGVPASIVQSTVMEQAAELQRKLRGRFRSQPSLNVAYNAEQGFYVQTGSDFTAPDGWRRWATLRSDRSNWHTPETDVLNGNQGGSASAAGTEEATTSRDVMGVPAGLVQSTVRDGVSYELYAADDGSAAFVRIKDVDSGEVVTVKRFPGMADAKAFFDESLPSATPNPASDAPKADSELSRRTDATSPAEYDAAKETIARAGLRVGPSSYQGRPTYAVTGNTYPRRDLIKSVGDPRDRRWDGDRKTWHFVADPTVELARRLAGAGEGGVGAKPPTGRSDAEDVAIREERERELNRPDERPTGGDASGAVERSTADLIRLGAKAGIPEEVLGWQIEDVGLIRKAFEASKRLFLLGSAPGSGKTFVIAGAIREMKAAGAKRFIWVTMNQTLIEQIKNDVAAYGINDSIEFATYADLSGLSKKRGDGLSSKDAVLIIDEAHEAKNETLRGKSASTLIADSQFTLLSSATPFENPVQAAYLQPSGIFDGAGGHTHWAILFGAQTIKIKISTYRGQQEKIIPRWVATKEASELAKGAKRWFEKQGILSQRPLKLAPGMVEANFEKYSASQEYVDLYDKVMLAYDAAFSDWKADDGQSRDAQVSSLIQMHSQNAAKRLLEAAKTKIVIERAKQVMASGRKVVIFVETKADRMLGRFRKTNDAKGTRYDYPQIESMMAEWRRERDAAYAAGERGANLPKAPFHQAIVSIAKHMHAAGLTDMQLPSVTDEILAAIPNAHVFTGDVSDKAARENLGRWRKAKADALVATMAKGGTGLSLHDKLGDFPTTMFVLNMPWTATKLEQVSGRINRYGLASVAHNFFMFADNIPFERKLAGRIGGRLRSMNATVKGLGSKAAESMEMFDFEAVEGVKHMLLADEQKALEGDTDAADRDTDAFDRANALERTRRQEPDKAMDYFATPYPIALLMAKAAGVKAGDSVLEPSAGEGNLLRFLPSGVAATILEPHEGRRMKANGVADAAGLSLLSDTGTFEDYQTERRFDAVVMNPPFSRVAGKGWQDITHVRKAWDLLKPTGRLVAIVSEGPFFREDKQSLAFRAWLDDNGATVVKLPEGAFKTSGTNVRARLIVVDRAGGDGGDLDLASLDADDVRTLAANLPTRPGEIGLHGRRLDGGRARPSLCFAGTCVGWSPSHMAALHYLIDNEVEITRNTFLRATGESSRDVPADTYGMSFHRVPGFDVYYFVHSAIEHVWAKPGEIERMQAKAERLDYSLHGRIAWHGSPHLFQGTEGNPFGEFNDAKIGTGEGAQAYGHGHYFAGARGVAEHYASMGKTRYLLDGVPVSNATIEKVAGERFGPEYADAAGHVYYLLSTGRHFDDVIAETSHRHDADKFKRIVDAMHDVGSAAGQTVFRVPGRRKLDTDESIGIGQLEDRFAYFAQKGEAEPLAAAIADAKDRLKRYRATLREKQARLEEAQANVWTPESIKDIKWDIHHVEWFIREAEALLKMAEVARPYTTHGRGHLYQVDLQPAEDEYLLWDKPMGRQSERVQTALARAGYWGKSAWINDPSQSFTGQSFYENMARTQPDKMVAPSFKTASRLLRQAGVRGIKYLDQNSRKITVERNAETGKWFVFGSPTAYATQEAAEKAAEESRNYNYVIFDPKDAKIERLYGRPVFNDDEPPVPPKDAAAVAAITSATRRAAETRAMVGDVPPARLKALMLSVMGRADTVLSHLGPAGRRLAKQTVAIANRAARRGNTDEADAKRLWQGLSRHDRAIVARIGQNRDHPQTGRPYRESFPELAVVADRLRAVADRSMNEASQLGVTRGDGKPIRGGGGWYPQVPNAKGRKFLDAAFHEGLDDPSVQAWADAQVAAGTHATPDAALAALRRMRDERMRGANRYFESYRVLLPLDCVEWEMAKTVPALLHQNAQFVEAVREWGPRFDAAKGTIEEIAEEAGGHWRRRLSDWIRASFGSYSHEPITRAIFGGWSNFETLSRLALSPISAVQNYGQQFVNTVQFGPRYVALALAKYPPILNHWIESSRALAEKIDRSGATSDVASIANPEQHGMGWGVAEIGMRLGGFVAAERANQIRSSIIAYEGIKADMERLIAAKTIAGANGLRRIFEVLASPVRTPTDAVARRVSRLTGMSDAQLRSRVLSGQRLTEDELGEVMVRMTRDTQFVQDLASEPIWFRKSPFLRLLFKFKTWGARQVGFVYENVMREAARGNFGPLIRLAIAALIAGELVALLRDLIRGRDNSVTAYVLGERRFTWGDLAQRMLHDLSQGGAFGLISDATYGLWNFVGGPAAATLANAGRTAVRVVDKSIRGDALGVLSAFDAAATEQFASKRLGDELATMMRQGVRASVDRPETWRTRTREWLREKSQPNVSDKITGFVRDVLLGRFTAGDTTGSNVLPYRRAADQIDVGDVDDAADYLYGIIRGLPDAASVDKAVAGMKQSMEAHSPLGAVADKDLRTFLANYPEADRKRAIDLHKRWTRDYRDAIERAVKHWKESRHK